MNLLFFAHSSHPGGAEFCLESLVGGLIARTAVQCTVVLPGDGPMRRRLELLGAQTLRVDYDWWCVEPGDRLRTLEDRVAMDLARVERALPTMVPPVPDVVLTNTLTIPWGAFVAAELGRPHFWLVREYGREDHGLEFRPQYEEVLNVIDEVSAHIAVPSRVVGDALFPQVGPDRLSVAYSMLAPTTAEAAGSGACFSRPGALKVALAGHVAASKGQLEAVRAIIRLTRAGKNVELCLLGSMDRASGFDAELRQTIASGGVEDRVHLLGFVDEVAAVFSRADVALMCSHCEAFGRVTAEAMMTGTPVVGTDAGGTKELIEDGVDGFLYPPGDDEALASRIAYFIDNPDEARRFGGYARESILRKLALHPFDSVVYEVCQRLRSAPAAESAGLALLVEEWRARLTEAYRRQLDVSSRLLEDRNARLRELEKELSERTRWALALESERTEMRAQIDAIKASRFWRWRSVLVRLRGVLAPGSCSDRTRC